MSLLSHTSVRPVSRLCLRSYIQRGPFLSIPIKHSRFLYPSCAFERSRGFPSLLALVDAFVTRRVTYRRWVRQPLHRRYSLRNPCNTSIETTRPLDVQCESQESNLKGHREVPTEQPVLRIWPLQHLQGRLCLPIKRE